MYNILYGKTCLLEWIADDMIWRLFYD